MARPLSPALPARTVRRHVASANDHLSTVQAKRLQALADAIGDDGRIPLATALDLAAPAGASASRQAAFRKFRESVAAAMQDAGVDLSLEVDTLRVGPEQRFCWFVGSDSVADEVAEMSERETRDLRVDHPVPPTVAEVEPPLLIYVSVANQPATVKTADEFVARLRQRLSVTDRRVFVRTAREVPLGVDAAAWRQDNLTEADAVLALIDVAYLQPTEPEVELVVAQARRLIEVQLDSIPVTAHVRGLDPATFVRQGASYSAQRTEPQRNSYVDDVCSALRSRLKLLPAKAESEKSLHREFDLRDLERMSEYSAKRRLTEAAFVDAMLAETSWERVSAEQIRPLGEPTTAVDRLVAWALDPSPEAYAHCALLGDTGMGKTTTSKLLTQRLLELRQSDPAVPLPIYLDLRDLPVGRTGRPQEGQAFQPGASLSTILGLLLNALEDSGARPTAEDLLRLIRAGGCVVIFDGLDEVLVHLGPADGQRFSHALWRAIEPQETTGPSHGHRPSKLLLSCRTHYFRSIRDEANHFSGQGREGPRKRDYLTLLMLPFGDEQIRRYLADNVAGANVEGLLQTIDSVHNLRELAARPYTLKLISNQLDLIERAKLEGRSVRAVDLYGEIAQEWLARDSGKHSLEPRHKLLLMEELAAELWRSGRVGWTVDDLDQWLVTFIRNHPEIEVHYRQDDPTLWKEDVRTATFIVRADNETFAFAHTSLREYFLARYLVTALRVADREDITSLSPWVLPVPSVETLDFLGQLLDGLPQPDRDRCIATLRRWRSSATPQRSELVFAYGLRAHTQGYPSHALAGSVLDGADLSGWTIGSAAGEPLPLDQISLAGSRLAGAMIINVRLRDADLSAADLTLAELHHCDLTAASFNQTILTGTIIRESLAPTLPDPRSQPYRTQLLRCRGSAGGVNSGQLWLIADPHGDGLAAKAEAEEPREPLQTLSGGPNRVASVGFSPDGTWLVSGSHDVSVRIWDATTGELLHALTGHTSPVNSVGSSPDGTRLISGSHDESVRIWDATTGELLHTLTGHTSPVSSVGFSPDGTRLVSGSWDQTVRIWNAATGEPLNTLIGHTAAVNSVGSSPDGTRLISGSHDESVRIWDAATGELLHALTGHTSPVNSVGFSPDGTRLISGSDDESVRIWDAATGELLHTLTGHTSPVSSVGFSPDGTRLVSGSWDQSVRIWDAATGELLGSLTGQSLPLASVGFSPDGTRLVSGNFDASIGIWDAMTGQPLQSLNGHIFPVTSAGFSADGTRLVTGSWDRSVRVWDVIAGEPLHALTGHTRSVHSVGFSPDGTRLVSGSWDETVRIWDATTGEPLHTLTLHTDWVRSVGFSPDGSRLASAGDDHTVRIWDATSGELLQTLTGHRFPVTSTGFSPDGTRLVSGSWDQTVRIWNAATGEPLNILTGHTGWVRSVGFSPDGTRLISGGDDASVRIWEAATGELLHTFSGHSSPVASVGFNPDGTQVISGGDDGSVRIWDVFTGEQCGAQIDLLSGGEYAVWQMPERELAGVSPGAWRYLGWPGTINGRISRLPAETYGPLPIFDSAGTRPT